MMFADRPMLSYDCIVTQDQISFVIYSPITLVHLHVLFRNKKTNWVSAK